MKSLSDLVSQFNTRPSKVEADLVRQAYVFAKQAHRGQCRYSGEPYFIHPLKTAEILIELNLDPQVVAAGLLHDVIEDAGIDPEVIEEEFGLSIRRLVEGVSKVSGLKLRRYSNEEFTENLRRFFVIAARDVRVVFIKLADRLHNMRTLRYVPESKQKRIARETLEIYSPLADRLGIGEIKGELEDLAFPYVFPEDYAWLAVESVKHCQDLEKKLTVIKVKVRQVLDEEGIKFTLQSRTKHLYSLYRKLLLWDRDFSKIYDLIALRLIVNTVEECYAVLGLVHQHWKPLLGRIKDYIAQPKMNGYRSLHTTVIGPEGCIFEVQIRTWDMHQEAERGLAAHWNYGQLKQSGKYSAKDLHAGRIPAIEAKLDWVHTLLTWQEEAGDPNEFLTGIKKDILNKRIFVFTPKGDVIDLPTGATPVDFAYAIHTEIGDGCVGAKIDGKMSPLSSKLENGQIVEIIKGRRREPNRDWLEFVVTVEAKRRIRRAITLQQS